MILAELKTHTEHLHRRVEGAVDLLRRTRDAESYAGLLGRLYGFYRPFEDRLAAMRALDGLGLDLPARRKTPMLMADLAFLGRGPDEVEALPRCDFLPRPATTAGAIGCLYVMEGATLGGQFVRKHVQKALGLSGPGLAFYASYGADTGRMWASFREAAEAAVAPGDLGDALAFAAATFEAFEAWVGPGEPAAPMAGAAAGPSAETGGRS
ncbi:Heme oxygenase [Aquisphaera giovannonii]|uniref:Heme oxygenase n=1 Tax=Aquisphaera giovannonii TaxID=406548 RepID=A0A5B9W3V7_9BACT|nr:biliverdin-producing heme oxygenase [Aquisphaera giovannonii]QEH35268.1 Heme oxygenase [Aquisphaera giovannonii]